MKKITLIVLFVLLIISCKTDQNKPTEIYQSLATVYFGGDIITMVGDSPEYVEALVERDGLIEYTGSANKAMQIAGDGHKMINLNGKTLVPGLIDGHAHFSFFSSQAIGAQILPPPDAGANDIPALISILREWNTPENRSLTGWIFGVGFDDSVLEENRFPTKHDLDQVSTEFPIMIVHISGHFASVNSKGLEILEINSNTPDPEGGIIRRENGNEPNGVLEELAAIPQMFKALTPKDSQAALKFFEAGQNMALSYGYTTAQDGRTMQNHEDLVMRAESGALKLDVVSYIDYSLADKYMSSKWNSNSYDNHYRIGGMKVTLDGSPQGRTAWRTIPYILPPDGTDQNYSGYPAIPEDSVVSNLYKKAFENNWQVLTHANGDAAIDQLIRTMKPQIEAFGQTDRRPVLIHGQYIRADQLDELKNMNVIASLFPLHTFYWGDWHKQIIGDSLGNKISPMRTALNKGLSVTIHTDAPVALPNLMRMVGITVERKSRSGQVIGADEKLTPYEALKAITIWSAFQHFEEKTKGTLEKGKIADLVILNKNPLKVAESEIKNIEVNTTIKNGKTVYQKE